MCNDTHHCHYNYYAYISRITGCGSTLYMGSYIGCFPILPYLSFHFQFQFNLTSSNIKVKIIVKINPYLEYVQSLAEPHYCPVPCHEGPCPPCEKSRVVWCRCGKGNVRVDCSERGRMGVYVCEKPCNKMKSCGRHRCTSRCCVVRLYPYYLLCCRSLL